MKKKAIWLFAGGPMQEVAAKRIKEIGFQLILTDQNIKCLCGIYADKILPYDTFDIENNLKIITELELEYEICAVITTAADCHYGVNVIANKLGLPGIDLEISNICRNKHVFRKRLTSYGLLQPKSNFFSTYKDALTYVKYEKLKSFVVKATDNSGSRGFHCIKEISEFNEVIFNDAMDNGTTGLVIIEELLIPINYGVAELSVETLWINGKMYFLNWVDRLFRDDLKLFEFNKYMQFELPWGVEIGHINPSQHTKTIKDLIIQQILEAGKSIGFDKNKYPSILKADIMLTDKGPIILELTPRLSGGWDSSLSSRLRGSDFVGGMIEMALGNNLDLDLWYTYFNFTDYDLKVVVLSAFHFKPKDCTGRSFAVGSSYKLEDAFNKAMENINNNLYI